MTCMCYVHHLGHVSAQGLLDSLVFSDLFLLAARDQVFKLGTNYFFIMQIDKIL
jgi:hypothetical protein